MSCETKMHGRKRRGKPRVVPFWHGAPSEGAARGRTALREPVTQALSRYPVRKIQATIASEAARKPSAIPRLRPTLTSPTP
jgi:hypothetical protein